MFGSKLMRRIFYSVKRPKKQGHSDSRDVHDYYIRQNNHEDVKNVLKITFENSKPVISSWFIIIGLSYYVYHRSKKLREKFEINYLTQLPAKDFDHSDYDYKYWELLLTQPLPTGEILNTDQACKENYVLLYHASIHDSHIAMQRFSRLTQYIALRKDFPIKAIFVGMDPEIDPETLDEYARQYSKDLIVCYPSSEEVREELGKIYQNIGCVYVLERSTGNVIYIIDPNKHPLEAMGKRLIFNISKNIDFRVSKEILDHNINIKSGHDEELKPKIPTY